jgi:hypothetical protein
MEFFLSTEKNLSVEKAPVKRKTGYLGEVKAAL